MQPVSKEDLKKIIDEAKKEGKDTSELEKELSQVEEKVPPAGERTEREAIEGKIVIESTGPARENDFEW